jgi:DNA-binding transcriptional MerR regulator
MTISYELLIGIIIFLIGIIGFFLVRFIKSIDQMNEILDQLRTFISDLQSDSKVKKAVCQERHVVIESKFKRIDEHIGSLYKRQNNNRNKISELNEKILENANGSHSKD